VPRRGYLVARLTVATIQQTFEVRKALEVTGAGLAAERADADAVARMRRLADYPILESTPESYRTRLSSNDQFHLAVAAAAGNGFLVDLVGRCLTQHNRVLSLGSGFAVLNVSVPQHHEIVDAIGAHDAPGARAAMLRHLEDSFALVMHLVEEGKIKGIGGIPLSSNPPREAAADGI
jgi:DNA-binding GntR family transcriptional regulator